MSWNKGNRQAATIHGMCGGVEKKNANEHSNIIGLLPKKEGRVKIAHICNKEVA